jgi:hypothetical protein
MAVYREGYKAIELFAKSNQQVFNDAADSGTPVKANDENFNLVKMLFDMYGVKDSVVRSKGNHKFRFTLVDEWAVTDGIKTIKQATEEYELTYTKLKEYQKKPYLNPAFKGMDAFVTIDKIK